MKKVAFEVTNTYVVEVDDDFDPANPGDEWYEYLSGAEVQSDDMLCFAVDGELSSEMSYANRDEALRIRYQKARKWLDEVMAERAKEVKGDGEENPS